jgi:hypothetical protein
MAQYNKKLNAQRQQIIASGRKDSGYRSQHKKGCGFTLVAVGLFMIVSATTLLMYVMDVV